MNAQRPGRLERPGRFLSASMLGFGEQFHKMVSHSQMYAVLAD
jgi:hypothetical protein